MWRMSLSVITALIMPASAYSQAISGSDCNTLANTIAAGYTTSFSDRDFSALRYYASCKAELSGPSSGRTRISR